MLRQYITQEKNAPKRGEYLIRDGLDQPKRENIKNKGIGKGFRIMKLFKKAVALVMALTMVLAMSVTAFAAEGKGTITIANADPTVTYTAYQIFEAKYDATNESVSYFATKAQKNFYTGQTNNPFVFTEVTTQSDSYQVTKDTTKSDANVLAFLQSFVTETGDGVSVDNNFAAVILSNYTAAKSEITQNVEFTNVPYGYYLITSNTGATVTIDSNTPNVTVVDKTTGPSWEKDPDDSSKNKGKVILTTDADGNTVEIKENSVNYGDTVDFQIAVRATNYNGKKVITEYTIVDTLGEGFTYNEDTLKVMVGTKELTVNTDYTLESLTNDKTFKITIPWATVSADGTSYDSKYASPVTIKVTYSATLTDEAVIAGAGNVNTAEFTFKEVNPERDPDNPETPTEPEDKPEPEITTTYTYALAIKKTAETADGDPLAGAKFVVKDADGKAIKVSAVAGQTGVYEYDPSGSDTVVSPKNGIIIIKGLEEGTYTLTETEAPAGYNLLGDDEEVVANKDSTTTTITVYYDKDGNIVSSSVEEGTIVDVAAFEKVVINNKGLELPSTGAMGTAIFAILGVGAVIGGTMLRSRKKDEE